MEPVIQTLKYECLHGFMIVAERYLNHIVQQFQLWYNGERCHSARDHLPPGWDTPHELANKVDAKNVVAGPGWAGLLRSYSRRAA